MPSVDTVLLSTSYFGPIQYFTKFILYPDRIIEQYDHYTKQTYRNRCYIFGANGLLALSIPVLKDPGHKTHVKDVRIDYARNWRKLHWKGIESAYMHSPFFEFYMDEIRGLLEKRHAFLLDLNLGILDYLLEALELEGTYRLSEEYLESPDASSCDCREIIHPKKEPAADHQFNAAPYAQVFADHLGFLENLSVIDLMFNEGPNARHVLEKCIVREN